MHEGIERLTKDRYLWKWDIQGEEKQETLSMMFLRVAKKIASAWLQIEPEDYKGVAEKATNYFNLMNTGMFMPSSPQLFNAMRGFGEDKNAYDLIYKPILEMTPDDWDSMNGFKNAKAAYGSCYAMGQVKDSIEDIYDSLKDQAMIFKAAGGFGASFSALRSKGENISTTKGQSCGAVEFMELFNLNTKKIALSGQLKRGANMFSLSVSHPDIEEFIDKKMELINDEEMKMLRSKYLEHANLSVEISDEFMYAVKHDLDWNLIDPHSKKIKKTLKARELYKHIIHNAFKSGEPGILMMDNINRYNPLGGLEPITSVNPCSEFLSFDKTVCNLASINIYNLINYETNEVIEDRLTEIIGACVEYLNLAILANEYPTKELTQRSLDFRPIGVGFMGLGSAFIRMGYRYGDADSQEFTKNFMELFMFNVVKASNKFFRDSGILFRHYDKSDYAKGYFFFKNTKFKKEISKLLMEGVTNSRFAAIAPNGSIPFIVTGTISEKASSLSGGVEPVFDLAFTRRVNPDTDSEYLINELDLGYYDTLKYLGYADEEILQIISDPSEMEKVFTGGRWTTAKKLSVEDHLSIMKIITDAIDMQASKTVNLPSTYTEEMLYDFYIKAYDMGLKGLTVFVDGSRAGILESKKETKPEFFVDLNFTKQGKILPKERPVVIPSLKKTVRFKESEDIVGIMNIEVGFDNDNNPFEVFIRSTTSTKHYTELFNAIGRLVSLALRSNADIDAVLKQIKKVKDWKNDYSVITKIIAETIAELVNLGKMKNKKKRDDTIKEINKHNLLSTPKGYLIDPATGDAYCPSCYTKKGEGFNFSGGCITCNNCGWSVCE